MEAMMQQRLSDGTIVNRMAPKASAQYYKTYGIYSPRETHYRRASCREVECDKYAKGWVTKLDISTVDGSSTANWIRMHSGRYFKYTQAGYIVTFAFPPGQRCFIPHQVALGRPELFVVQGGDWRGNPMRLSEYRHQRAEDWVEDIAIHTDKLITAQQRG